MGVGIEGLGSCGVQFWSLGLRVAAVVNTI